VNWLKNHAHVIFSVVSGVGLVITVVATNTTNLMPTTVGKILVDAGAILVQAVMVLAGGKVAGL
jgi:hypothetical protein